MTDDEVQRLGSELGEVLIQALRTWGDEHPKIDPGVPVVGLHHALMACLNQVKSDTRKHDLVRRFTDATIHKTGVRFRLVDPS